MNPKQLACVILMAIIGLLAYVGQMGHKKTLAMKKDADLALQDSIAAESARQTAEILTTRIKAETDEVRRFYKTWTPYIERVQTEQEVESAIELSLRDRNISLVKSRKSEVKSTPLNKLMPKTVLTTLVIEDEYAKVLNWFGEIEKRLPMARVNTCRMSGGSTVRQMRLDVTIETPLFNLAAEVSPSADAKKKS
jgi:hypothetical protein